ncbi:MAG: zinc ABC transporter substrate-binding protein [Desulfurococcales archaeon]|nr:zinc ABC transporter substrate-binding protein [Desulfurococcales archaeon]
MKRGTAILLLALLLASVAGLAFGKYAGYIPLTLHKEKIVVVTFPNLKGDVQLLVKGCDIKVISLAPPGVDPHSYTLSPEKVKLVKEAMLVVSTGHAPFELSLRKIVPQDKLVEINKIPGIKLAKLPGSGKPNPHMPILDPHNYKVFINYIRWKLGEALPKCYYRIYDNMANLTIALSDITRGDWGILGGPLNPRPAVITSPPLQYAVQWLGLHPVLLLSPGEGATPPAETVEKVKKILENNGVAVVMTVPPNAKPYSKLDAWLINVAKEVNATVFAVPAPFALNSTIKIIYYVSLEATALSIPSGVTGNSG